jgi:tetratricopeptide (TPR) repeat protein
MMYAARVENKQEGYALMRKAYALNPDEKYLNYYYGVMLQNQDSMLESEKYFLKEKKNSNYYECDYYLSQIAYRKHRPDEAEKYLEAFLAKDSMNAPSSNNLLLLYVQAKKKDKALAHISTMRRRGVLVDPNLLKNAQELQ